MSTNPILKISNPFQVVDSNEPRDHHQVKPPCDQLLEATNIDIFKPILLGSAKRNIYAVVSSLQGELNLHIRKFYPVGEGKLAPTGKGITLNREEITNLFDRSGVLSTLDFQAEKIRGFMNTVIEMKHSANGGEVGAAITHSALHNQLMSDPELVGYGGDTLRGGWCGC